MRHLKSDDPEIVDLAAAAIASLAGQGTYTTEVEAGGVKLKITERGFAGSGDTLGNQIWPSAFRLCTICSSVSVNVDNHAIAGRRVIELGCGPGLPGLLCARLGASAVLLTDFEPGVLEIARKNIRNNPDVASVCEVAALDWTGNLAEFVSSYGKFDIVLAADCVYNAEHAAAVANAIAAVLQPTPEAVAVIVLGDRSARYGIDKFEEAIVSGGLVVQYRHEKSEQSEWIIRNTVSAGIVQQESSG